MNKLLVTFTERLTTPDGVGIDYQELGQIEMIMPPRQGEVVMWAGEAYYTVKEVTWAVEPAVGGGFMATPEVFLIRD